MLFGAEVSESVFVAFGLAGLGIVSGLFGWLVNKIILLTQLLASVEQRVTGHDEDIQKIQNGHAGSGWA